MNILIPVHQQYVTENNGSTYYNFITKEIVKSNDNAVILEINPNLQKYRSLFGSNVKFYSYDESKIHEIIHENRISHFFAHASFSPNILKLRDILLTEPYLTNITSIWHEGGFLRNVCNQFDWYGWNAYSSLANIKLFPEVSNEEVKFVDYFMNGVFLPQKITSSITRNYIKNNFGIIQDNISLIVLQVYNDSVLKHFADPKFNGYEWVLDFTNKHRDTFFIIKDHPKQRNIWTYGEKGLNWIYLHKHYKTSTMDFVFAVDSVVTVNSTMGMESLYWKPVYIAGQSVYSKFSKHIDFFSKDDYRDINLINRFFHYAIMKFHYTPKYNANSLREWFEKLPQIKAENKFRVSMS